MDSTSKRVAALQKEAQELSSEAAKLRKGASDPAVAGRLKEIVARLKAIESEYSAVLTASPIAAVDAVAASSSAGGTGSADEVSALKAENRELCRRSAELEKLVTSLQRFQHEAKDLLSQASVRITAVEDKEALLLRRLASTEREMAAARQDLAQVRTAGSVPGSAAVDDAWLEGVLQQFADATSKAEQMQLKVDRQASKIEARVTYAKGEITQLKREVGHLETALTSEHERANAAELVADELRQEVLNISSQVAEAKTLMQKAKAEGSGQGSPMLRDWAQNELQRLKQQLAASSA